MPSDHHNRAKLHLTPALPLPKALAAAFDTLVGYAIEMPVRAKHAPEKAVHEFRKTTRRLRALTKLVREIVGESAYQKMNSTLGAAARSTSGLRDDAVLLSALDDLQDKKKTRQARALLRHALAERCEDAADAQATAQLLQECSRSLRPTSRLFHASLPQGLQLSGLEDAFRDSLRRTRRSVRKATADQDGRTDSTRIHTVRKRVKELRYQLEMLTHVESDTVLKAHRGAANIAETLGQVTDLIALSERVQGNVELPKKSRRRLLKQIQKQIDSIFADAHDRAVALFDAPPRQMAQQWIAAISDDFGKELGTDFGNPKWTFRAG
ncbi:MAG: CHAD domain-containing protein [Planctomycetota bacterium]